MYVKLECRVEIGIGVRCLGQRGCRIEKKQNAAGCFLSLCTCTAQENSQILPSLAKSQRKKSDPKAEENPTSWIVTLLDRQVFQRRDQPGLSSEEGIVMILPTRCLALQCDSSSGSRSLSAVWWDRPPQPHFSVSCGNTFTPKINILKSLIPFCNSPLLARSKATNKRRLEKLRCSESSSVYCVVLKKQF